MEVIDLTQFYNRVFTHGEDLSVYVNSYPSFFRHYFTYWGSDKLNFIKLTEEEIIANRSRVTSSLQKIRDKLDDNHIDTSCIKVILFIGQNVTNGHAFLDKDISVAFIAIECYNSELYSDVFCAHEISHAVHYLVNPDIYFNSHSEKDNTSRQLISEGVATYMTKELLNVNDGVALWADCLTQTQIDNWMELCESKSQEMKECFLMHYYSNDLINLNNLFYYENLSDPYQSRGGYWLGLKLMKEICQADGLTLKDILKIKSERIFNELKKNSN